MMPSNPSIRSRDMSISALLRLEKPPEVAIYEPALELDSFSQSQGALSMHNTIVQYLSHWYGFPTLATWDFDLPAKILVVDEIHLPTLLARQPDYLDTLCQQTIIVLCANPSRQAILAKDIQSSQVELICKPFGPFKLARTICRALERAAKPPTTAEYVEILGVQSSLPSSEIRARGRGRFSIDYGDLGAPVTQAASPRRSSPTDRRSSLVPKPALSSRGLVDGKNVSPGSDGGFPFNEKHGEISSPVQSTSKLPLAMPSIKKPESPKQQEAQAKSRPGYGRALSTISPQALQFITKAAHAPAEGSGARASDTATTTTGASSAWEVPSYPQERKPVILLVDDNQLNLDLLQTFVTRKGWGTDVLRTAADGQEAVEAFNRYDPDIVFMDLSMPVMDGHEATRAIRQIESERMATSSQPVSPSEVSPECEGGGQETKKRTLIVALTGNAKGVDQTEAFDSGVDIYMTKPVSFKQVGKLLENWREGSE